MPPRPIHTQALCEDPASTVTEVPSVPPFATNYGVREPVVPPDGHGFRPAALNAQGDLIGNFIEPLRFEGASWNATGHALSAGPAVEGGPFHAERALPFQAISSNGLIAGTIGAPAAQRGAWASHIGPFGRLYWPDTLSFAQGVNAAGVVIGKTLLTANPVLVARAFLMRPGERPQYFNPPDGGLTDAIALNDEGGVLFNVTALSTRAPIGRAWLWQNDTFIPLELPPRCASTAIALNAHHHAVGLIETEFGLRRPTLWIDGHPQDLETTMAEDFVPTCLNDHLVIGGSALNRQAQRAACVWTASHGLQFLDELTPDPTAAALREVVALNNSGQILATLTESNRAHGFVLEPAN